MFEDEPPTIPVTIDCHTCVAAGTTACNECVVGHLLANDDGPIELVLTPPPVARAVELLDRAGLLDDPPVFVSAEEFADGRPAAVRAHPSARRGPRTGR